MSYVRNPRSPFMWESDGEYDKPGFKAKDGIILATPEDADARDKYLEELRKGAADDH